MTGRPAYQPTEKDRRTVRAMAAYGIPQDEIAAVMELSEKPLRRHFRRELRTAATEANAKMAGKLFAKGMAGDTIAMMFWLKCRAGWSERLIIQDGGQADDYNLATLSDAEIMARIGKLSARLKAPAKSARALH